MPHVTLTEILMDAKEKKYAIPCLMGGSLEMLIGEIRASEVKKSPLILFFHEQVTPNVPIELGISLIVNAARMAKVPVATILDHGTSFNSIIKAIHYGVSSVMYDGSALPYEENVERTREIVKVAHAVGVSVEAELGNVGGSAIEVGNTSIPESIYTDPEMVVDFTAKTGIDALAISFGNLHGLYRGEQKLDYERVGKIKAKVGIPLVMHGGSGLSVNEYRKIVESGISKINYYSAMARKAAEALKESVIKTDSSLVYHDLIDGIINFYEAETGKLLDIFGCSGTAS
jgi:fructose-bisphosphate aldolase class II